MGVSPFRFCPPKDPAAVADCDTPPAIARQSLLQSEIAAGISHREAFFRGYSLQVMTQSRYLGGFVETEVAQDRWLEENVEDW